MIILNVINVQTYLTLSLQK